MTDFTTITACGECCVGCSKKIEGSCPGCIEADGRVPEWAESVAFICSVDEEGFPNVKAMLNLGKLTEFDSSTFRRILLQ